VCLIFDRFSSEDDAAKFVVAVHKKYPNVRAWIRDEADPALDVFPYALDAPIVYVERIASDGEPVPSVPSCVAETLGLPLPTDPPPTLDRDNADRARTEAFYLGRDTGGHDHELYVESLVTEFGGTYAGT